MILVLIISHITFIGNFGLSQLRGQLTCTLWNCIVNTYVMNPLRRYAPLNNWRAVVTTHPTKLQRSCMAMVQATKSGVIAGPK